MINFLLEKHFIYSLWQAPFISKKLKLFRKYFKLSNNHKVLDLGCGPGTNAPLFKDNEYLGVDINDNYIEKAKKDFPSLSFITSDLLEYKSDKLYDLVFINSLLHHVNDNGVNEICSLANSATNENGTICIIDLILPEKIGIPYILAKLDRGSYPRKEKAWNDFFSNQFLVDYFEVFDVKLFGITLWKLVYCQAKANKL